MYLPACAPVEEALVLSAPVCECHLPGECIRPGPGGGIYVPMSTLYIYVSEYFCVHLIVCLRMYAYPHIACIGILESLVPVAVQYA